MLARLAGNVPLLPAADVLAFVDIDSTQKRVYGHAKQGAAFGHTKIQGKSLLIRGLSAEPATLHGIAQRGLEALPHPRPSHREMEVRPVGGP